MASSIEAVYMVEASPPLREAQKRLLCGDAPMTETSIGFQSTSKYANIPVIWTENLRFVPKEPSKTPFIVAHEFFDALPIHAFESVEVPKDQPNTIKTPTGEHPIHSKTSKKIDGPQWREMVVSPTPPGSSHADLHTPKSQQMSNDPPEFELSLSKSSTPHSMYLPEISPRYKALKGTPGSVIEISPESQAYVHEIAKRIGGSKETPKDSPSGAALIIDYGPADTIPINSLRGIRNHQRVSPFTAPGLVDLSADVDFTALAEAALNASLEVEVHGPVEQGTFLLGMGIKERAEMLLQNSKLDEEKKKRIESAWKRLTDRGGSGMGKVYKAMAIVPDSNGQRRPVGFGGDVVSS
jgi:NADH dehydrogenase [ubiquinone] 1 alpha subcomplex assembly factor 7